MYESFDVAISNFGCDFEAQEYRAPWENHPYQPISWLEMLQFSARMFFWCGHILQAVETDCLISSIPVDGDTPLFAPHLPLDERARTKALRQLRPVEQEFRNVGLQITSETAEELIEALGNPSTTQSFRWLIA